MRANIVIYSLAVLLASMPAVSPADTDLPLISVTGQAEVKVVPDDIIVTLGVSNFHTTLEEAKQDNDHRTRKVLALADKFKINAKDVQTSYLNIQPMYKESYADKDPGKFLGYSVDKTIVFKIHKVADLESLITEALKAGANQINSIDFRSSELRKHRDQARLLAVRAAREKARLLAEELEMTIGKPYRIDENPTGGWARSWNNQVSLAGMGDDGEAIGATFALGQIAIIAQIHVSFELVSKPPKDHAR